MEEALLGQKQIRQYFQHFTQTQWDRVAKATMMLGIQQVMLENRAELFWDLSRHSVETLDDLVVTKEKKLIQKQSAMRNNQAVFDGSKNAMEGTWPQKPIKSSPLRNRSKGSRSTDSLRQSPIQMERGAAILPTESAALRDRTKKDRSRSKRMVDKAVHFSSESPMKYEPHDSTLQADELDANSVAPQLSVEARDELERRVAEMEQYESTQQEARILESNIGAALEEKVLAEMKTMPARRHQKAFDRLKGSSAMGSLLKADEAVIKRQRKVSGTLRGQPKQRRRDMGQRAEAYYPVRPRSLQERELRKSRSRSVPSHGRPSSRWRSGVRSEEDLAKQAAEDIKREVSTKSKGMVYPTWWQGYDTIQKSSLRQKAHAAVVGQNESSVYEQTIDRGPPLVDGRMMKKRRMVEDSLDARLNAVRHGTYKTAAFGEEDDRVATVDRLIAQGDLSMTSNNLDARLDNLRHRRNDSGVYYDSAEKLAKAAMMSSNATGQGTFQSVRDWRKVPHPQQQNLTRTNGSMGSFAYTSNKRTKQTPKYTALTPSNPKHANQPMTYAGPPNEEELARDAMRHMSGNRNFTNEPYMDSRVTSLAQSGASSHKREKPKKKHHKRKDLRKEKKDDAASAQIHDPSAIYLEQKRAAERNRRQVEGSTSPLRSKNASARGEMNGDLDVSASQNGERPHYGSGLEKKAKGGIAMTVFPAPPGMAHPVPDGHSQQAIRHRSDSQSRRYPFMDSEPFKGNPIPLRERSSQTRQRASQEDGGRAAYNQRRVPQRLSHVESTLKAQIEADRTRYLERIKEQNNVAVDERRPRVYDEAARSRQSTPSPGKDAQIFYKKQEQPEDGVDEEAKEQILQYEEGRDDYYQGPALKKAQQRAAMQAQIPEGVFVKPNQGYPGPQRFSNVSSSENEGNYYAEIDPNSSQEAAMYAQRPNYYYVNQTQERPDYSQYAENRRMLEEMKASSARGEPQYNQGYPLRQQHSSGKNESATRVSYNPADVNETGFTTKLAAGGMPSSISYSGEGRTAQRVQPAPFMGTGYYDRKGRYVAVPPDAVPAYVNSSSQGKDSSQEAGYPKRDGADNNTSRFGQMPSEPRYQGSHLSSSAQMANVNEASSSAAQISADPPLVAVKSGEFSAQGPSDPGNASRRDEPYKYYDGGHEEVQARMNQLPPPPHGNFNTSQFANSQADRRPAYEPRPRGYTVPNYSEQHSGETTLSVNYKRDRPQALDAKQASAPMRNQTQTYISDGYSYTGPVAPGTNNFTLQRPNESNSRAKLQNYYVDEASASATPVTRPQEEIKQQRDYRISSGPRNYPPSDNYYTGNAPPPNSKYYQTFNDAREHGSSEPVQRSGQDKQHSRARSGSQESGSVLKTNQENNFSATGGPMRRNDLEHGSAYEDGADTRTENLRNFMEQAQPGDLINSHGPSGGAHSQLSMSHLQGSNYNRKSREPSPPNHDAYQNAPQETSLQNVTKQHVSSKLGTSVYDPSSRTEYKEGGSVEQQSQSLRQKQIYDLQGSHNFTASNRGHILSEYPPHGTSIEAEDRLIRASDSYDEESSPEISVTEQSQPRSKGMEQTGGRLQASEKYVDPSSSSLQTPAHDGPSESGRNTDAAQSSSYSTQQVSAGQHQRSLINIQETEQVQQEIAKLTRDMQELTKTTAYGQQQMLTTEEAKSSNDDSSSLSNSASESDPGKPQQQQDVSEELSAVNISG